MDATGNIYVANYAGSIFVYAAGAVGNVAPMQTISGSKTRLNSPIQLALDASANVNVANYYIPGSVSV